MRLDSFISQKFNNISRQKAIELIKNNQVIVNDRIINKSSFVVKESDNIRLKDDLFIESRIFCSRAAFKIQRFLYNNEIMENTKLFLNIDCIDYNLKFFLHLQPHINTFVKSSPITNKHVFAIKQTLLSMIKDSIILDVGASAGGFTQVLLSFNPKLIIAQDIGNLQLDSTLRQNKKVFSIENLDIREFAKNYTLYKNEISSYINSIDKDLSSSYKEYNVFDIDFLVCDVSFISIKNIFFSLLHISKCMLFLFKPQYEVGLNVKRNKKGVIKDSKAIQESLESFITFLMQQDAKCIFMENSLLKGKEGNEEFFIFCQF